MPISTAGQSSCNNRTRIDLPPAALLPGGFFTALRGVRRHIIWRSPDSLQPLTRPTIPPSCNYVPPARPRCRPISKSKDLAESFKVKTRSPCAAIAHAFPLRHSNHPRPRPLSHGGAPPFPHKLLSRSFILTENDGGACEAALLAVEYDRRGGKAALELGGCYDNLDKERKGVRTR